MAVRYWDYWEAANNSTTTAYPRYYHAWTNGTSTATSTSTDYWYTATQYVVENYLVSGFDDWSDVARATFTRLVNDETNTGFKVKMWIKGDVDIVDMSVQHRDLDWFMLRLRQVASKADYDKIAACVETAREEAAQAIEARSGETGTGSTEGESAVREANASSQEQSHE